MKKEISDNSHSIKSIQVRISFRATWLPFPMFIMICDCDLQKQWHSFITQNHNERCTLLIFKVLSFNNIYDNKSNHRDVLIKVVPKRINIWSGLQLYSHGLINFISIWVHMIENKSLILSPIIWIKFMFLVERNGFKLNKTLIDANRTFAAGCWWRKKEIHLQIRQWMSFSIHNYRFYDVRNRQIQYYSRFPFPRKIMTGSDCLKDIEIRDYCIYGMP